MATPNGKRPATPPATTGYELRLARLVRGLRINDISRYTGISTPMLSLVERGKLPLTAAREKAIRDALQHAVPRPGGGPRVRVSR